jgi:hypothetical protein
MDHVNVPHAVRPYADQVVAVTDAVCRAHLDMSTPTCAARWSGNSAGSGLRR